MGIAPVFLDSDALIELPIKVMDVSIDTPEGQTAIRPAPQVIIPSPSIETLPSTKIGKDDRERVLIPAGEFLTGSDEGHDDEKPGHQVCVEAFYMDRKLDRCRSRTRAQPQFRPGGL